MYGTGGGIWVSDPSRMSLTSVQVLNNQAPNTNGTTSGRLRRRHHHYFQHVEFQTDRDSQQHNLRQYVGRTGRRNQNLGKLVDRYWQRY